MRVWYFAAQPTVQNPFLTAGNGPPLASNPFLAQQQTGAAGDWGLPQPLQPEEASAEKWIQWN